jgi:hypothetical protein
MQRLRDFFQQIFPTTRATNIHKTKVKSSLGMHGRVPQTTVGKRKIG